MALPEFTPYMELAVATVAFLGVLRSAVWGYLRTALAAPQRVHEIQHQQDEMCRQMDDMADALVGVAYSAKYERVQVAPEEIEADLLEDTEGPGRYVNSETSFIRSNRGPDDSYYAED